MHQVLLQRDPGVPVKISRMEFLPPEGGIEHLAEIIQKIIEFPELGSRDVPSLVDPFREVFQQRSEFPALPQGEDPALEVFLVGFG